VGHEFADADKTGGDGWLCWVAVAANMVTFAGYADDEQEVFELMKTRFDNKAGQWYDAVKWYLKRIDVDPDSVTVREYREDAAMDYVACALKRGEAVMIRLHDSNYNYGHVVSVYGYDYRSDTETYKLYYAESNDGKQQLRVMHFTYNYNKGRWENDTYKLTYAASLRGE
jgi:hypothetical protein